MTELTREELEVVYELQKILEQKGMAEKVYIGIPIKKPNP